MLAASIEEVKNDFIRILNAAPYLPNLLIKPNEKASKQVKT